MVTRHSDKVLCVGSNPTAPTMNNIQNYWEQRINGSVKRSDFYGVKLLEDFEGVSHAGQPWEPMPKWFFWSVSGIETEQWEYPGLRSKP